MDNTRLSLRLRARGTFWLLCITSGAWWLWVTILATRFRHTRPTYDWSSEGFGSAFAAYVLLNLTFQVNYMFL